MQGNGILRIGDILSFSDVSTAAGTKAGVLSFQRGYLPILQVRVISFSAQAPQLVNNFGLLQYLSSEFVLKSPLAHFVK